MNYYKIPNGYHKPIIVRGNDDDLFSFEVYKENKWQPSLSWADKIMMDSFGDYKIISEQEALQLIA